MSTVVPPRSAAGPARRAVRPRRLELDVSPHTLAVLSRTSGSVPAQ